jgi:ankyrin repeat protein
MKILFFEIKILITLILVSFISQVLLIVRPVASYSTEEIWRNLKKHDYNFISNINFRNEINAPIKFHIAGISFECPLIHYAVKADFSLLKIVISNGGNVDNKDKVGNTPLHVAIEGRYIKAARLLCKSNAIVDIQNRNGETPLHLACKYNFNDEIDLLEQWNANFMVKDNYGRTPLWWLIINERGDRIETLLKNHEIYHSWIKNELNIDDLENVGIRVSQGIFRDRNIYLAAKNGNYELVVRLLKTSPTLLNSKDKNGNTLLHLALPAKNIDLNYFLIKNSINVFEVNNNGSLALHVAARVNDIEMIKKLENCGISLNAIESDGNTIMHIACWNNYYDQLDYLLQKGLSPFNKDGHDRDCFELCIIKGSIQCFRLLYNLNNNNFSSSFQEGLKEMIKSKMASCIKLIFNRKSTVNTIVLFKLINMFLLIKNTGL